VAAVTNDTPDDFAGQVRVRRVRFRSQDNRFAILEADADRGPVTPRLRDIPLAVEAEDVLHVSGRWQTHPTHGRWRSVGDDRTNRPAPIEWPTASRGVLVLGPLLRARW
jgi:hypothetical protein